MRNSGEFSRFDLLVGVLLIVLLGGMLLQYQSIGRLEGEVNQLNERLRETNVVQSELHAYAVSLRSKMIAHGVEETPEPPRRTADE